jgi:hypothetical protein
MGFYLELRHVPSLEEFSESEIPRAFWALYLIAGFALICMGLAAHTLLGDLLRMGSFWDWALVTLILLTLPIYFLIGLKLGGIRKFISTQGNELQVGYRCFGKKLFFRRTAVSEIKEITLYHKARSTNFAPQEHEDAQYYVRGHWRVGALLKNGKQFTLDRHTEEAALVPLADTLRVWLRAKDSV